MTFLLDAEEVRLMRLMRERTAFRDMAYQMQRALLEIARLHPSDTDEGYNEWGEAECFHKAQRIALDTLKALTKEYGNNEPDPFGLDEHRSLERHSGQGEGHPAGSTAVQLAPW